MPCIRWYRKVGRGSKREVLEETDGYVDDPEMLISKLTDAQTLKIEFHPGDTY